MRRKLFDKKILLGIFKNIVLFNIMLFSSGCFSTYYIQKARVTSLGYHYPISITDNKTRLKPIVQLNISHNTQEMVHYNSGEHTKVNGNGIFVVTPSYNEPWYIPDTNENIYDFTGANIFWRKPLTEYRANVEVPLFRHFSLLSGVSYGRQNNKNYWGIGFGYNIFFELKNYAFGIESFVNQNIRDYSVDYVDYIDFSLLTVLKAKLEKREGRNFFNDSSLGLTINTKIPDDNFNYVLKLGYGRISYIDIYSLEKDGPVIFEEFGFLTIGAYKNINRKKRMIVGLNNYLHAYRVDPVYSVSIFVQYDILF